MRISKDEYTQLIRLQNRLEVIQQLMDEGLILTSKELMKELGYPLKEDREVHLVNIRRDANEEPMPR